MPALLFLSSQPGSGRSFTAANLAPLLRKVSNEPVTLLETCTPEMSELALYTGLKPIPEPKEAQSDLQLICCEDDQPPAWLKNRVNDTDWVLVDGLDLSKAAWPQWLECCGRGLLLERGDLVGARRMALLLKEMENAHFAYQGLMLAFAGSDPAQPLPNFKGLPQFELPSYPRATERLAQTILPATSDKTSSFIKALKKIALALPEFSSLQARPAAVQNLVSAVPIVSESKQKYSHWENRMTLLRDILSTLRKNLDLEPTRHLDPETLRTQWEPKVREAAAKELAQRKDDWLDRQTRAQILDELVEQTLGYGPLADALNDPQVSEIMVNHPHQIYLEKEGRLQLSDLRFWDSRQLMAVIERIVAPLGRRIDESSPMVDARLPDGSRVNAIIPPLAILGPCLTIRKFPTQRLKMADLLKYGSISQDAATFLQTAVQNRRNLVVSGGTGSGKTTLLNVLSGFIPEDERIVTVEDSAELKLTQEHVVTLESRPPNLEGRGEVSIRDLVKNCLRMRPDRIVVGECRGGEALDMLQAMNTGHDGSLTTVHANTSRDALYRLETLCLMSDVELPLSVVRRQIASSIDLIVQQTRLKDGARKVTAITQVLGMEGDIVVTQDLFIFKGEGKDGQLEASGLYKE